MTEFQIEIQTLTPYKLYMLYPEYMLYPDRAFQGTKKT